ncbi:MAG: hypothetical protein LAO23_20020 [Acidobacteriia bacterium]|nr:hypothetical protein [Terriglobia bacterium]
MKMKPAITITTTILVSVLAAGLASAQSPSVIQTTRDKMNTGSGKATAASNAALGIRQPAAAGNVKPAAAKSNRVAVAPPNASAASANHAPAAKQVPAVAAKPNPQPKPAVAASKAGVSKGKAPKVNAAKGKGPKGNPPAVAVAPGKGASEKGQSAASEAQVTPTSKNSANGRRDPFISPVVSHMGGSGCSTGKKCLEIGAINLRGVVHAESGFIAVVSNSMNKAYFLRENDPVFNGYVVKITGDSIVFQETVQDRLGKTFTREVVKKITTPAV